MTEPVTPTMPDGQPYPRGRDEAAWRALLKPAEYQVLRLAGTEPPFVGAYTDTRTPGTYHCRACDVALFESDTKFESHCGWPSFFAPLSQATVIELDDNSLGRRRTEIRCAACGSHLGHVFAGEGYGTPTDLRYCINSISLRFEPRTASVPPD
jgi:peptide-methionine (R)-S-oxide reductase